MSFVAKYIKSSKGERLHLVLCKASDSHAAWWYILVDALKLEAFREAMEVGNCDLKEYGEILKSGYGDVPPKEAAQEMQKLYDFEAEPKK